MKTQRERRGGSSLRRLVLCGVFAALAYAVMFAFRFHVLFLTFDLKDAVITIAGLLLGPVAAAAISLVVATLELTVSDTGFYGFLMNVASSVTFSVTAAVVYRFRKRLGGAVVGLSAAAVALVGVMTLLNLLVTPFYMGVTTADVAALLPRLLLPFNAIKGVTNAALVLVLYKPISRALRAAGMHGEVQGKKTHAVGRGTPSAVATDAAPTNPAPSEGAENSAALSRRRLVSLLVTGGGLLLLAASLLLFYLVLGGDMEIF